MLLASNFHCTTSCCCFLVCFCGFRTPPVLCNGRLYCRNYSGDMICIDVSK
jgi:hypothetical protein